MSIREGKEFKSVNMGIRLTPSLHKKLIDLCDREGIASAKFIYDAIARAIDEKEEESEISITTMEQRLQRLEEIVLERDEHLLIGSCK